MRLAAGISIREAAELTGLSKGYLSQMENGYVPEPSPFTLKRLSEVYKCSYRKLFDAAGYPRP